MAHGYILERDELWYSLDIRVRPISFCVSPSPSVSALALLPTTCKTTIMQSNIFSSFFALAVVLAMTTVSLAQSPASSAPLKTLPYHFTLAALNTTLPNVNDTGVPLVITGHGKCFYCALSLTALTLFSRWYSWGDVLHHDGSYRILRRCLA